MNKIIHINCGQQDHKVSQPPRRPHSIKTNTVNIFTAKRTSNLKEIHPQKLNQYQYELAPSQMLNMTLVDNSNSIQRLCPKLFESFLVCSTDAMVLTDIAVIYKNTPEVRFKDLGSNGSELYGQSIFQKPLINLLELMHFPTQEIKRSEMYQIWS